MMNIYVCIGSSCHLRGSYDVIQRLKELVAQKGWEEKVQLNASFCLGHCTSGCTIKIDDEIITGVNKDNVEAIVEKAMAERE